MCEYLAQHNLVQRPNRRDPGIGQISIWAEEQIWGHRLWDSQTPWLLFLEFLTVAEACLREGKLFDEGGIYYPLRYKPYRRMYLRNILFNNDFVSRIDQQYSDSRRAWDEWLERMEEAARGVENRDFSYLRARFATFHDFASLVSTIRSAAVESNTNRRWSSRFVFPFGPHALYEDVNVIRGNPSREYINFGRTGELLYLMLCRSKFARELREAFLSVFDEMNSLNNLLRLLQPEEDEDLHPKGYCYLPYIYHPGFDVLAEDWINAFKLQLPGFDVYQHLVFLGGFHMMLYQLATAEWFCPNIDRVTFICEVIAPKKTLVRELSITSYQQNNVMSTQAVDAYISRISESEEWQKAIRDSATEADAFIRCKRILDTEFWWGDDYDGPSSPLALLKEFRERALKGHRQHVGNVHRVYGRGIGLISKRGTNRLRYAPNDAFLKTLLLTNVPQHMELNEFLASLYYRYGLIFGEREAAQALPAENYDQKAFQANTERLERRLSSMGMLQRLSDGYAYVVNPFGRGQG